MSSTRHPLHGRCLAALAIALLALSGKASAQEQGKPARDSARTSPARRDTVAHAPPAPDTTRSGSRRPEPITLPPVTLVVGPPLPSPWRPYAFRSIGYVGAAGFGLFLTTRKKSSTSEVCTGPPEAQDCVRRTVVTRPSSGVGRALALGAVLAGLGDAFLTSHRAHARAQQARTGLLPPSIEPDGAGARVSLVRWQF